MYELATPPTARARHETADSSIGGTVVQYDNKRSEDVPPGFMKDNRVCARGWLSVSPFGAKGVRQNAKPNANPTPSLENLIMDIQHKCMIFIHIIQLKHEKVMQHELFEYLT